MLGTKYLWIWYMNTGLKCKKVKRKVQPKWFTSELCQEILKREKLLIRAKHSQSESDWLNYKQSRNNVSKLVRESQKSYFNKKMSKNKHISNKLWDLIKGSTQESDPSPDSIEHIKCKGGYLADKESISNELNNFFVKQQIDLLFAQNIGKYIAASNYHKGTQFHHTKPQEMMASVQGCQRSQPVQKARK